MCFSKNGNPRGTQKKGYKISDDFGCFHSYYFDDFHLLINYFQTDPVRDRGFMHFSGGADHGGGAVPV